MKIIRFLFSVPFMVTLLGILVFALAAATFIEDMVDTQTARALIYNARWLEVVYLLLVVNLIGNLVRFKLWRKEKWLIGLFHGAIIIIIIGAALTRYTGYRGLLHFREGETTNRMLSDKAYFTIHMTDGNKKEKIIFPMMLSAMTKNNWQKSIKTESGKLHFKLAQYLPKAVPNVVRDSSGGPVVTLTIDADGQTFPLFLRPGEQEKIGHTLFGFGEINEYQKSGVLITLENSCLRIQSDKDLTMFNMQRRKRLHLKANQTTLLKKGILFQHGNLRFALQSYTSKGRISAMPTGENLMDSESYSAVMLNITGKEKTYSVTLFGGLGIEGVPEQISIDKTKMTLAYGALTSSLPFRLRLNDFIIERYPGSRMPSTYESQITILDPEFKIEQPYRIYMNHILKYRGYRLYQTSYDEDELGSILSVARDPGTPVTYTGYAILMVCLILNFFHPKSRFRKLGRLLSSRVITAGLIILFSISRGYADHTTDTDIDKRHADHFSRLIVQDERGRMKPIHSLTQELLRDLGHPERALNLSPSQWILFVYTHSKSVQKCPMIPLEHKEINRLLNMDLKIKFAPASAFFEKKTRFIFKDRTRRAEQIPKYARSNLDHAVLKIKNRLLLIQQIQRKEMFRLLPVPGDSNQWDSEMNPRLNSSTKILIRDYRQAVQSLQWDKADSLLQQIDCYQRKNLKAIIPSSFRRDVEILYNNVNIFQRLIPILIFSGLLLFTWKTVILIKPQWDIQFIRKFLVGCLLTGFFLQTSGLILRWMASGHAPWTNKYESMIYISWSIMLSGIIFIKNSRFPLSLAAILAGFILKAAHMPWADPRITNLLPVLKSHWLITHVSVVTSSYGFFSLSAAMGLFTLIMVLLVKKYDCFNPFIDQMTWINERSMMIGLALVTIGNLLGAIWANESWGRYWGWDPKETWTLIVILIYAIIIHLRLIPAIDAGLSIIIGSIFAFWAVIMTYIGVNFYLSGIHSYAAGEAPPLPKIIFFIIGLQLAISVMAWIRKKQLKMDIKRGSGGSI